MDETLRLRSPQLKWVNRCLIVLILAINAYILILPLTPQLQLWWRQHHAGAVAGLPYKTNLAGNAGNGARQAIPTDNRLVIPKITLNQHVYTGTSPYLVNKGVWARPNTSTPPKGGNTVMVAHRFTYSGPATFYSLDKLQTGDPIVVYWQGKEYDYKVSKTEVVPPTAVQVEAPTPQTQLTLYTCTPLWSAKNRLVVIALPTNTTGAKP